MDDVLNIVFGSLQTKAFNFGSQLLHQSLLHRDFLKQLLMLVLWKLLIDVSSSSETSNLRLNQLHLLSQFGILLYESSFIFGVLIIARTAQLHTFYLIY